MPRNSQIVPEHLFPHRHVVINDNSEKSISASSDSGSTKLLYVFASPKGRDTIQTIDTGLKGFLEEYGIGPFWQYGQPLLNAYNAAQSGAATLHCLRVTAPDAKYAVVHVVAKYKVESNLVKVKLSTQEVVGGLTSLDVLADSYSASPLADEQGFSEVRLFSVASLSKGSLGDNLAFRITSNAAYDKNNIYKNYFFGVYEQENGTVELKDTEFLVCFNEDAIVGNASLFIDGVVNDPDTGSTKVKIDTNIDGFTTIYNAYKSANPDTDLTFDDFDVLLGINKYTKAAITNYTIDTVTPGTIDVSSLSYIYLSNGSDGKFSATTEAGERKTAMTTQYKKAYMGDIDPFIASKNKYPTNIIFDAGFDPEVKVLIANLAAKRKDCVAILDITTDVTAKNAVLTYVNENLDSTVKSYVQSIEAYSGKIRDPYSKKLISVTGTYGLSAAYPVHFNNIGSKHIPLAGNTYGVISGYIKNSIYPVFDEDIDATLMDELCEAHVNFARVNALQNIIRATQDSRNYKNSNLSELSNVFITLDIKRDCENLCAKYEYNFSETDDLARFNTAVNSMILPNYADAQVRSISARFDKNTWEAEQGYVHLYIELVNKDIIRTSIIEIDVNREA